MARVWGDLTGDTYKPQGCYTLTPNYRTWYRAWSFKNLLVLALDTKQPVQRSSAMLTSSAQADLEKILASDLGQLAKWQKIQKKLLDSDLAWYTVLSCDQLAVHPCNRGGSGVQPFEVHKKREMIVKNGADLGLLASSVCFELSPAEAKRQEQMHFNQALVNASGSASLLWQGKVWHSGKKPHQPVCESHFAWRQDSRQLGGQWLLVLGNFVQDAMTDCVLQSWRSPAITA